MTFCTSNVGGRRTCKGVPAMVAREHWHSLSPRCVVTLLGAVLFVFARFGVKRISAPNTDILHRRSPDWRL